MIRYVDCRTLGLNELRARWDALVAAAPGGTGAALTAWQAAGLGRLLEKVPADQLLVTVPDFLHYGRLVNTGQGKSIADLPGSLAKAGVAGAQSGLTLAKRPLKAGQMDFWHFAEVLLRYDLALIPGRYRGSVMLHSHLMDFASVFQREGFARSFFHAAGKERATGVHTQQVPAAVTALAQWGLQPRVLSYLAAPGDIAGENALRAAVDGGTLKNAKLIAEVDSWPADLQGPLGVARFSGFRADALLTGGSVEQQ